MCRRFDPGPVHFGDSLHIAFAFLRNPAGRPGRYWYLAVGYTQAHTTLLPIRQAAVTVGETHVEQA